MELRGSILYLWLNGNMFPMLNYLKNLDSGLLFQGQRIFDFTLWFPRFKENMAIKTVNYVIFVMLI